MAKLILYGGLPFLKTIIALYGKKMQKIELTNEDYVAPTEIPIAEQHEENVEAAIVETVEEVKPKKKRK